MHRPGLHWTAGRSVDEAASTANSPAALSTARHGNRVGGRPVAAHGHARTHAPPPLPSPPKRAIEPAAAPSPRASGMGQTPGRRAWPLKPSSAGVAARGNRRTVKVDVASCPALHVRTNQREPSLQTHEDASMGLKRSRWGAWGVLLVRHHQGHVRPRSGVEQPFQTRVQLVRDSKRSRHRVCDPALGGGGGA
jgi:hypothetical protein